MRGICEFEGFAAAIFFVMMARMIKPPNILSIAGSDSGAGAGIQADLKTIMALNGYGLTVISALTAQNGLGVSGVLGLPPDFVALEMQAVLDGFEIAAAKTGMLFSAQIIRAIAPYLEKRAYPLVVDPVCVSQSGDRLLEPEALESLKADLLPLCDLATPNVPEAEALSGLEVKDEAGILAAGEKLLALGSNAILIKGGHISGGIMVTDWLFQKGQAPKAMSKARVETGNSHGTGCTLSAAIATYLGRGMPLYGAISQAQEYINLALRKSYAPGKGAGPVNHAAKP